MAEQARPGRILGYGTNVHAGASLDETIANLAQHAAAVKRVVSPAAPMGVGLWLSAQAARVLIADDRVGELGDGLRAHGLRAYTLNGFPYGDFHQPRVKHAVYEPDWYDERRLEYTIDLADALAGLLSAGEEGSISTLPVGWPPEGARRVPARAVANLRAMVEHLAALEERTGRLIHVDLEPEPGCEIDCARDVVEFFAQHLGTGGGTGTGGESIHRYLRVCHDICHSAVMFEDQRTVLQRYRDAGVRIGKVQITSALRADLAAVPRGEWRDVFDELGAFAEERYLHQTAIRSGGTVRLTEDLPRALRDEIYRGLGGEWRVHCHVPIFLERIGRLLTTQQAIVECLGLLSDDDDVRHFEVETYTWDVLPAGRSATLAGSIAEELRWARAQAPAGFFE